MNEKFEQQNIRSEQEVNDIVNNAVKEVIDTFADSMIPRDKEVLLAVTEEKSTNPTGRVMYLHQIQNSAGVSEKLKDYINQVLLTLRQQLSQAEQEKFLGMGKNLLDEIDY